MDYKPLLSSTNTLGMLEFNMEPVRIPTPVILPLAVLGFIYALTKILSYVRVLFSLFLLSGISVSR
jgi:hypothetical protein